MSAIRLLVGTRKGAFVLTSDGRRADWKVSGPHFAGWEIYHLKGSPVNPDRLYASQTSGWFGQQVQRSENGGETWEPVGHEFAYEGWDTIQSSLNVAILNQDVFPLNVTEIAQPLPEWLDLIPGSFGIRSRHISDPRHLRRLLRLADCASTDKENRDQP